jgi:anaerobic nitric oxide reductase transcription regulator
VYPVPIPALRERGNDVLMLAGHFLELNRARLGLRGLRLSPAAERALLAYSWPGNVRELEHVISRAALKELSRGTSRALIITLEPQVLDLDSAMGTQSVVAEQPQEEANNVPFQALSDAVDECQRQKILHSLRLADDNWARAARMLEVDASNLHKLARRLGLK